MSSARGVLYIVWPSSRVQQALQRSMSSVGAVHPELPIHVEKMPEGSSLLDKSRMFDLSPFEETLFLDADTVVMDRLDFGFVKACKHQIAACVCECPWARRYGGLKDRGDMVEYNTGVLFFARESKPIFDGWKNHASVDSSIIFRTADGVVDRMRLNDQASFALAVDESNKPPFVLPLNWNMRPQWHRCVFGSVKIWHDYSPVPATVSDWNKRQGKAGAIIECLNLK